MSKKFNIAGRAGQKRAAREEYERKLRSGEVSAQEVQKENSHGAAKLFRRSSWKMDLPDGSSRQIRP